MVLLYVLLLFFWTLTVLTQRLIIPNNSVFILMNPAKYMSQCLISVTVHILSFHTHIYCMEFIVT